MKLILLFLLTFLISMDFAYGQEELVMVQTISADEKTFVIRKGSEDDIRIGMDALFSSKNATVKAKVIKTTRYFSIWKLLEENAKFPFKKRTFVTYNRDLDTIWYSVPTIKTKYNYKSWTPVTYWTFRTGYSYTVSESITETSAENRPVRTNLQMSLLWNKQVRENRIDWGWGFRYDSETARTETPIVVSIPTQRLFLMTEFTFHFPRHKKSKDNFYGVVSLGFGTTSTQVDTETTSGYTLLFPSVTLGFLKQIGDSKAMMIEATGEVINSEEKFANGTLQTSNALNAKLSLGFKF